MAWTGEANGLQPGDDIGNRKSFKPIVVPPDDIGNRRDPEEEEPIPSDDIGNRVDQNPTHEMSGVLLDLDPKKRRRRSKGAAPLERVGRYVVGGVNPLVAGGNLRPVPPPDEHGDDGDAAGDTGQPSPAGSGQPQHAPQGQPKKKKFEHVDGHAAQAVSEQRAQRFFDFDEDDRFEYTLKSDPEVKRKEAEVFVGNILREAGRDAVVVARILPDGDKPKLLVTIDERGPAASLPPERRADNAAEPLFVLGNGALLSLNYLVNKVVNRYPDDRIRLAVLPAVDEKLYLESLEEHRRRNAPPPAPTSSPPADPAPAPAADPAPVPAAATMSAPDAETPAEGASAKRPRRGRKKADAKAEAAAAASDTPDALPPPPAPVPSVSEAAPPEAPRVPRKAKDVGPLTPPPPAIPPAPAPASSSSERADEAAHQADKADKANHARARMIDDDEAPRGRRPPPLDEPPARPAGTSLLKGRARRASTALVEVVRVPKKP